MSLQFPNGPDEIVSYDFFQTIAYHSTQGNRYVLLFNDRFSQRAAMYSTMHAELEVSRVARIFVNSSLSMWGCPARLLSDSRLQFCAGLSRGAYCLISVKKLATRLFHTTCNGGTEHVDHTRTQMVLCVL